MQNSVLDNVGVHHQCVGNGAFSADQEAGRTSGPETAGKLFIAHDPPFAELT